MTGGGTAGKQGVLLHSEGTRATARGVDVSTQPIITPAIFEHYPDLSDAQKEIVGHLDGPLLVIAGPGSGKTYSIVLRALNLLLLGKAEPKQLILCTFTEKAAFEMRDRLAAQGRRFK
jgi:UvrD/REP helicase N-terminal domain